MTMSEARNAGEAASVQLDEPVPLHHDNVFEGGDEGYDGHAEPIQDMPDLSDQSAGGMSALQRIQSLFEKAG